MGENKKSGGLWFYQVLGVVGTVIGYTLVTGHTPPLNHAPVIGIVGAIIGGAIIMTIAEFILKPSER